MSLIPKNSNLDDELRGKEEKIKQKEELIIKQKEKLSKKKYDLQEKEENQFNWEERRLNDRLSELRNEDRSNDNEIETIKEKIAEFKFKEIEIQKSQQQVEDSLLRAIKLNHLEEIARKKVELQRIADQRKELEKKELQNSAHLEALVEEQQRRDDQSLENLRKILNKAENIEKALKNGDLDRENQILLAHALEEGGDHAEKQRKRMVDEILAKRQREKQERVLRLEDSIRDLNEQRWGLVNKHEDLLKKRRVHQALEARGIDFLAENEMGKIPNISYIIKNLEKAPIDTSELDQDAETVVNSVYSEINPLKDRIAQLKTEKFIALKKEEDLRKVYSGEADVKRLYPDVNISTYTAIKDLVYDIVDDVWNTIVLLDKNIKFILLKKDYYIRKSKALKEKAMFYSDQMVLRLVSLVILEEVIEEITYEVAEDYTGFIRFSENIITNFIASAVIDQRGTKLPREKMADILKNLIKDFSNN